MRVVAIVQARMGSTRLPGKVMMDLAGEPLMARVVERTARGATVDEVVVATSDKTQDNRIARLCAARGWPCFRGNESDVLDRYYQAAREYNAEAVVRITADNPLVDHELVDRVVGEFVRRRSTIDYASNCLGRQTYPMGLSVEVICFEALEKAWRLAGEEREREHVTLFVRRHPELFHLHGIYCEGNVSHYRWTVDTVEDMEVARRIYEYFGNDGFSWQEAVAVMVEHPEWEAINRDIPQRDV
jgi:spore coat polysaccharide biosynthesis protein SpsF